MRRVGVMIGSESDLPQCKAGIEYLLQAEKEGKIEFITFIVNSIHRNTEEVLENLYSAIDICQANCMVIGAGMANHLTGTCEAYINYGLRRDDVHVIGCVFEGKTEEDRLAAILSIKKVPGTGVIFNEHSPDFLTACKTAVEAELPQLELRAPKETKAWHELEEVLDYINQKQ